jgi:hypothetical protein
MGLNMAVIVVGGWGGRAGGVAPFGGGGTWADGGVASGRVVNRMPADTTLKYVE